MPAPSVSAPSTASEAGGSRSSAAHTATHPSTATSAFPPAGPANPQEGIPAACHTSTVPEVAASTATARPSNGTSRRPGQTGRYHHATATASAADTDSHRTAGPGRSPAESAPPGLTRTTAGQASNAATNQRAKIFTDTESSPPRAYPSPRTG
jgi:hypothetical protein